MAVFRVNKTTGYTVMSNYHLRDRRLTLKSKGLLSLILSLPDSWNYTIGGLVALCIERETSVKTALNELKRCGYLRIDKIKPTKETGGKYKYIYNIFEQPLENQGIEIQGIENQPLENIPLYKDTNSLNTDISNINTTINDDMSDKPTRTRFIPPTVEEVKAYCEQRNNNVDAQKFWDYYDAAKWYDSKGVKMKSWKQKVITWEGGRNNGKRSEPKKEPETDNIFLKMLNEGAFDE